MQEKMIDFFIPMTTLSKFNQGFNISNPGLYLFKKIKQRKKETLTLKNIFKGHLPLFHAEKLDHSFCW